MSLDALFEPESVAVVGASRTEKKVGHSILNNLIRCGFKGTIIPINPAIDELQGLPCFPSLSEYGKEVDLVVVALPQSQVKGIVAECAKVKAKAMIVTASGFRETGPEGASLEQEVVELCQRNNIRLLGPNCLGLINTGKKLNASFAGETLLKGGLSVFSQSGALCSVMVELAHDRNLGLAKVISIGNKADISSVDILSYLAKDEQTKVIVGYLEDIATRKNFVKAAEEAASQKPVIILKSGTTPAGLKAAASHTGVLATGDSAYGAAFKRAGVIRADSFEALFDSALALSMQPLPKGNNVLIIANAGGPAILAADAVEQAGMNVVELDEDREDFQNAQLPDSVNKASSMGVLGDVDPEHYARAIKMAQADPSVHTIMVILTPQAMSRPAEIAKGIAASIDGLKPLLAVFILNVQSPP
jgi:acetyltransferase